MKKLLSVLTIIALVQSCKEEKSCNQDSYPQFARNSSLGLDYVNKAGQFLLPQSNPLFVETDVTVKDVSDKNVPFDLDKVYTNPESDIVYYRLRIFPFLNELDTEGCRRVFVTIKSDIDTLDYCYKMDECEYEFDYVRGTYNNQVVIFNPRDRYSTRVVKR